MNMYVARVIEETKAKRLVYEMLSNLSDERLLKRVDFSKDIEYIRLDNADAVDRIHLKTIVSIL